MLPCFILHFWFLPSLLAPLCSCPLSPSLPCNLKQSWAISGRGKLWIVFGVGMIHPRFGHWGHSCLLDHPEMGWAVGSGPWQEQASSCSWVPSLTMAPRDLKTSHIALLGSWTMKRYHHTLTRYQGRCSCWMCPLLPVPFGIASGKSWLSHLPKKGFKLMTDVHIIAAAPFPCYVPLFILIRAGWTQSAPIIEMSEAAEDLLR